MFVWECMKTKGTHLGMCMDGFMFGSCCVVEEIEDTMDEPTTTLQPTPTTTSTTTTSTTTTTTYSPVIVRRPTRPSRPVKPAKPMVYPRPQASTASPTPPPVRWPPLASLLDRTMTERLTTTLAAVTGRPERPERPTPAFNTIVYTRPTKTPPLLAPRPPPVTTTRSTTTSTSTRHSVVYFPQDVSTNGKLARPTR